MHIFNSDGRHAWFHLHWAIDFGVKGQGQSQIWTSNFLLMFFTYVSLNCIYSSNFKHCDNKHTESIAKAIQVPHRPQQIQICNSLKKLVYCDESELDL